MKSGKKRLFAVLFMAAVMIAGVAAGQTKVWAEETEENVIADNVSIGGIAVGGMTEDEAETAVEEYVAGMLAAEFTLTTGDDRNITATGENLGLGWGNTHVVEEALELGKSGNLLERYKARKDLEAKGKQYELIFTVDDAATTAFLAENEEALGQEAVNNGLKRENGAFTVIEGHEGISLDVASSLQNIKDYLAEGWNGENATITLTTEVTEPVGTTEELEKVQDVLGDYNTDFSSSSAARIANIENAVNFINGTVLYPGEEFSVYDTIGPLDASNGYELAGAYENGATVESYGGGVCQISSTLYNAVLEAELEVTERAAHSMMVNYVEPSRDAAIAGDYKNFKFVNNLDTPIYIEGYTSGKILYFTIYGEETRPSNRVVTYESEIVSETPRTYEFTPVAEALGVIRTTESAHIGKVAKLWKIVTVDGVEESREVVNNSRYNGSPQKVSVGTATDNPEAAAAITAALATGDAATIYSTVAQYTSDAAAAASAQSRANTVNAENAAAAQAAGTTDQAAADQAAADQAAAQAAADQAAAAQTVEDPAAAQ